MLIRIKCCGFLWYTVVHTASTPFGAVTSRVTTCLLLVRIIRRKIYVTETYLQIAITDIRLQIAHNLWYLEKYIFTYCKAETSEIKPRNRLLLRHYWPAPLRLYTMYATDNWHMKNVFSLIHFSAAGCLRELYPHIVSLFSGIMG